jgi:hypothetical protein
VWVVGETAASGTSDPNILHWDGTRWNAMPGHSRDFLMNVSGSAPNNVWAVGFEGVTLHWDGQAITSIPTGGDQNLYGVYTSGPGTVWAVGFTGGTSGVILRGDGASWSTAYTAPRGVRDIWGSGASDVWAIGEDLILHWDGASWSDVTGGQTGFLQGVWGRGGDVWIVGVDGLFTPEAHEAVVLHKSGGGWVREWTSASATLYKVAGSSAGELIAVGGLGAILRR